MADYAFAMARADTTPEALRPLYARAHELYENKLWYQLVLLLNELLAHPASQQRPLHIVLYDKLVRPMAQHMSPLKHAHMAVVVSRQYESAENAYQFLSELVATLDNDETRDAYVLARIEAAHFQLLLGQVSETRAAMDECERYLDALGVVEPVVHASYFRVCGNYYKSTAEYASYYKTFLRYLACINVSTDLTAAERIEAAHDLALAALLGDSIYNFGELLQHEVLTSLAESEHKWLGELLRAFHTGDIGAFEALSPQLTREEILATHVAFLRQKMCLMALVEYVFHRSPADRTLSFEAVATATRIPVNEVEHLVMKALALGLVKGSVDEVDQQVHITWVQPRVLDPAQQAALLARLDEWCAHVDRVREFVHAQAPELFAEV
ncbi:26S proteasome regulatory subunit [Malassezia cuniculi]|uniref:26S proteasome regulatory subunit n=1 Tax=Malassezia cuniculi TaxID=948313 RepID=A0AAF0J6F8_9BASI|nr:26S proteasome regulatory subunit [Malassezia cuniculi]